ncbi:3-oxoacyl-ACP synthase III family protein [Candidatus Amoebophilus asiaticus]|uniref:3-oxoacyl-ACP synthase III family protein n=1 Tax=Candidatus Amoebophilus asiaticus TaxID=281120 RepID=UPI001650774F|nr:3-oxoacyl-[acyl-carrier-protein] synthase III C-terminal domain-containing protein [Candidatus Amoebophilus asiaticus]
MIKTASYLPERVITNDFFCSASIEEAERELNPMFRRVKQRRHVSDTETPTYMIVEAINKLLDELNLTPQHDIDMILTNVSVPEEIFMGCGAIVAKKIGARPKFVFDFHHSGCISFVTMLDLAKTYIQNNQAKSAIICNVQNSAGCIFGQLSTRNKPHARVPGDGCGIAYILASEESPILSTVQYCYPENAESMYGTSEDGRKHWQPGNGELYLDFNEAKIVHTIAAGNKIVPMAISAACKQAGITHDDIDFLVTTQPSALFLRNWREAVQLSPEKHIQTFAELGNLFGAAIPINFTYAIEYNLFQPNNNIVLAGFSHAGDFAAASVIKWQASSALKKC